VVAAAAAEAAAVAAEAAAAAATVLLTVQNWYLSAREAYWPRPLTTKRAARVYEYPRKLKTDSGGRKAILIVINSTQIISVSKG